MWCRVNVHEIQLNITCTVIMLNISAEQALPTSLANSSLLPFLLLSLAAHKFVPDTKAQLRDEYDYIIVGAGSAGSVLANRLSEIPYANVLILEAGGDPATLSEVPAICVELFTSYYTWGLSSVPQKYSSKLLPEKKMPLFMGKCLGGSSSLNGMAIIRGNRANYDGWRDKGATGWGYDDVLPYFKKLETVRVPEFFNTDYHGFSGPIVGERPSYEFAFKTTMKGALQSLGYQFVDINAKNQYGIFDYMISTTHGKRCSTAKAYLVPADRRCNLDIVSMAFVTKVIFKEKQAVGVEVEFGGKTRIIRAKEEVILSAGTMHTPKLLMLSGVGPEKHLQSFKIPVIANLPVGQNLHDHIGVSIGFQVTKKFPSIKKELAKPQNILKYIFTGTGVLSATAQVAFQGFLSSSVNGTGSPDFEIYLGQGFDIAEALSPEKTKGKNFVYCDVNALPIKSRGSITLNSTDPHDSPLIDPNYFSDPDDVAKTVEGLKVCMKIYNTKPFKKIGARHFPVLDEGCRQYLGRNENMYLECLCGNYGNSFWHYAGTSKMGRKCDPSTVVDPELRVKGISSLRVVDASIMPQVTSGNTNIPVIMIAEKAADMIKKDWYMKHTGIPYPG